MCGKRIWEILEKNGERHVTKKLGIIKDLSFLLNTFLLKWGNARLFGKQGKQCQRSDRTLLDILYA